MTSRERILAAVQCESPDQTPVIVYPAGEYYSDAAIVKINRLGNVGSSPRAVLAEILNPFARAFSAGVNLNAVLHDDPAQGEKSLTDYISETQSEIEFALQSGADGIFYRLQGAEPKHCSPMQYGGHYLEADRALLERAGEAKINVLFLECGPDLYFDCLTDLPAQILAWEKEATRLQVADIRRLRKGTLATADPEADILFGRNYGLLQPLIQKSAVEAHV